MSRNQNFLGEAKTRFLKDMCGSKPKEHENIKIGNHS
jgi:hypothetical protein